MSGRGRTVLALAAVSAGVFVTALDQTMVVTVLPSILRTLHISATRLNDAAWIVTGYLLGYTVAMPLFGRLADVWSRRIMWAVAVVIFMGGSLGCVLAGGLSTLVAARVVQAAGGGALVPIAMAVSASLMPVGRRAFALGVIGAAAEAGGVLGPLYGATLSQHWGWHTIFLVNLPLGVCLVTAGLILIPRNADQSFAEAGASRSIDYGGVALMAVALACLTIGLNGDTKAGTAAVHPLWLLGSAVAFSVFMLWERRQAEPLIRLSFFRRPAFAAANLANLAVGAALVIGMVEIPLYAFSLLRVSEISGGLLLMRLTVMIPVGALAGGWLADRIGYRATAVAGFILTGTGYLLISLWPDHPSNAQMTSDLMLTGLGFGLVIAPISATVIASAGERWMATGSALVTVMRMVGMMVGLSALSSWGIRRFNALMAGHPIPLQTGGMSDSQYKALTEAYTKATDSALNAVYSEFFLVASIIAFAAVVPALFFLRRQRGATYVPFLPQ
jgi:EmrB/QacA subfamily drug resistance transporter